MIRELQLRRYAAATQKAYLEAVQGLAKHYRIAPDRLTAEQVQDYLLLLINERKLQWNTVNTVLSGLTFFYTQTLKRPDIALAMPARRTPHRLPDIYIRIRGHWHSGTLLNPRWDLEEALKFVEEFSQSADPLNNASCEMVCEPGADAGTYKRALLMAEAACRLKPENASFLNTLGVARYRVGQFAEARAALEKSLSGNDSPGVNAANLYFLALCHYRLGDAARAQVCFERARDRHKRNAVELPKNIAEELGHFQAEAEAVLGRTKPMTNATP
jgi:tetratricopeptide (TPR) repeat protein